MTKLDLQYDLVNYTPASASPVEANFGRIEQHINQELIERDGTVAMAAQLKLVGDPVAPLDAAPKQYVDAILPVGIIMMYGGAAAPPGGRWALCNGAELQTTDYPELSALLGTAYGGSAGRFNLPNLNNKFPYGAAPGATGGSADAAVPAHTHPIDHTHALGTSSNESQNHQHTGVDHLHGVSIQSGGASARHLHQMPPISVYQNTGAPQFYLQVAASGLLPGAHYDLSLLNSQADSPDHSHAVNGTTQGADRSLTTGGITNNHTHPFQTPAYGGASGLTGVAATNANLPPYLGLTYIIRVN